MKILAFAASNSRNSINKALVIYAANRLTSDLMPEAEIATLDLSDYEMPIYSIDRQNADGIPELAKRFMDQIGAADALLISYAEHNGFYTAAFKNVFDWASRIQIKVFQDKPMVVMSTSPGPNGGGNILKTAIASAPFFGAEIVGSLSVARFPENFDLESGSLTNPELAAELDAVLASLEQRLKRQPNARRI